ncbi:MAG: hypothetical protein FJ023_06560 [Chloroflexi bacterium]|nr:hypothetical protein [Chloroflexota bacterium]
MVITDSHCQPKLRAKGVAGSVVISAWHRRWPCAEIATGLTPLTMTEEKWATLKGRGYIGG